MEFPAHPNISVRLIGFCHAGWRQKLHYLWFCLWVIGWTIKWRPHWIYLSDALSCPLGLILSYFQRTRLIYHEHDSPQTRTQQSTFIRFILWARRNLVKRIRFCVLPNNQRAKQFAEETGSDGRMLSVWNCPSREEVVSYRQKSRGNNLQILYHGSIVPSRLPLTVFEALALLPNTVKVRIIGYETVGSKGYLQRLQSVTQGLGVSDRIEILGPLSRSEMLARSRECDVGLSLIPKQSENFNFSNMVGASNKPFDYLACGLALLVSDIPDWKKMYVEPGYGLACDPEDSKSIARSLQWFLDHPKEMREMGERGRQKILAEWNYEQQFWPVLVRLQE